MGLLEKRNPNATIRGTIPWAVCGAILGAMIGYLQFRNLPPWLQPFLVSFASVFSASVAARSYWLFPYVELGDGSDAGADDLDGDCVDDA